VVLLVLIVSSFTFLAFAVTSFGELSASAYGLNPRGPAKSGPVFSLAGEAPWLTLNNLHACFFKGFLL